MGPPVMYACSVGWYAGCGMNVAAPITSTRFETTTFEPAPCSCWMIDLMSSCKDEGAVTGACPSENATFKSSLLPSHTVATCAWSDFAAWTWVTPWPKPARIGQKFWLSPFTSEFRETNCEG